MSTSRENEFPRQILKDLKKDEPILGDEVKINTDQKHWFWDSWVLLALADAIFMCIREILIGTEFSKL